MNIIRLARPFTDYYRLLHKCWNIKPHINYTQPTFHSFSLPAIHHHLRRRLVRCYRAPYLCLSLSSSASRSVARTLRAAGLSACLCMWFVYARSLFYTLPHCYVHCHSCPCRCLLIVCYSLYTHWNYDNLRIQYVYLSTNTCPYSRPHLRYGPAWHLFRCFDCALSFVRIFAFWMWNASESNMCAALTKRSNYTFIAKKSVL